MLDTVKRTISDYMMLETGENVLVALSGGADSAEAELSMRRSQLHKAVHRSVHNSAGKSRPAEADAKAVLPPAPPADSIPAEWERPLDEGGCAYKPCPRSCCP